MFTIVAAFLTLSRHRLFLGAILLLANCVVAPAQIRSVTDGYTPSGLAPGAPVGSYELSGFESVNPYNGGLNFSLPIKQVSGRGGASYTIRVPIENKWRAEVDDFCDPETGQCWHFESPIYGSWDYFNPYGPGELVGRRAGTGVQTQSIGCHYYQDTYFKTTTRLTFTVPGGTEFELRDQLSGGQPATVAYCAPGPASRGTVFVTADGTSATFVSDTTIYDEPMPGWEPIIFPSGYLMLKDGTRYRIDNGLVSWIRDRNGNKLIFTPISNGFIVTDSLNRQITVERVTDIAPYGLCDRITFKGFAGTARVVRVSRTNLGSALRSGYVLQSLYALWPELNNASPWGFHDPEVISRIWLPDGRSYKFLYNSYGELARAELPTGGAIEYDWAPGVSGSSGGGAYCTLAYNVFAYRRVIERRVYPAGGSGGAYESRMTISKPESTSAYCTFSNVGYVNVKEFNSSGTLLSSARHHYFGSPTASFINSAFDPTTYPSWKEGKEWQTEMLAANDTTVLRRVGTNWQQRAAVSWWTGSANDAPANDPRVADITTTLVDTNQVSKQTFSYDDTVPFNNPSDVYEYGFGSGTPGGLIRRTHTDYLKTNPVNSTNYTTTAIHIRHLPTQTQVFDASGVERARATFEYDNYANDGSHAPLQARSNISGLDSAFTTSYVTRGNLTRATNWILSTSTQLHSYAQYDVAGNMLKAIDPRGFATTIEFADRFGSPDSEAQGNTAPSELSGLTSYAFATKVTNALGHINYSQFDYYLGRPVNGQDANGIVASGAYSDALDRPTQVKRAIGTAAGNQAMFAYDDTNRVITTTSDRNSNNDNGLVSKLVYDGFGRTTETRQYEGGTNYTVTQQQYDSLGRPYKVSNPFRPYLSETAVWTTTLFDALGRVTSVTTPDNAVVTTAYNGNAVTVTDQAGKARKSVTDALGRLIAVYEDPSGLNYQTSYAYNALDSLTTVTQGVQTRTFVYDSLRRLTSATNPESGAVSYTYDNNSNLLTRLDARSITTTLAYDALNRVISKTYNDNPQTATVNYFYDAQTLPGGAPTFDRGFSTGRLVAVTYGSGSSAGTYRGYDQMGRVVRQYQRTDSVNYLGEASYYANSSLQNETYPAVPGAGDRRVVNYTNDNAGRLSALSSAATSYAPAASVSSIGYASHNGLKTETYGNSLIHAITYNNRLQPTEIKLGASGAPTSIMGLVYNYGATNNNGNVQSIGYSGGGLSNTQTFGYDALNRLTTSQENSGSSWSQTNAYDRYGNRWIDLGGGNQSLYFNTSNNRITGWSYDNAGNLLNDGYHSYSYDGENKISKVDGVSAYIYNGEGQRVRKLVGENTRFIYGIGGQLIAELDGATGNLRKEYVYGGASLITIEPAAVNSNGTQYTTSDNLGSPRVITKAGGIVASRHDYQPFGIELGAGVGGRTTGMGFSNSGDTNRKKFTQYERDNETGLDYAQARYYSSSEGRFTTADPLMASARSSAPQTWNRYSYGLNNPLRYTDPSGLNADDIGTAEDQRREQLENQRAAQQSQAQQTPQTEPTPVATQSATLLNVPMCGNPIPTTVVVDQMNNPGARVRNINGTESLVVGVDLRFTFLDQQGRPVSNAVVGETVEDLGGGRVTQTTDPTPLTANGEAGDLVSNNSGPVPTSKAQLDNAVNTFNQDFTTRQRLTLTVVTEAGIRVRVTQERTLTNTVSGAPSIQGVIKGYTFTMQKPTIEILK